MLLWHTTTPPCWGTATAINVVLPVSSNASLTLLTPPPLGFRAELRRREGGRLRRGSHAVHASHWVPPLRCRDEERPELQARRLQGARASVPPEERAADAIGPREALWRLQKISFEEKFRSNFRLCSCLLGVCVFCNFLRAFLAFFCFMCFFSPRNRENQAVQETSHVQLLKRVLEPLGEGRALVWSPRLAEALFDFCCPRCEGPTTNKSEVVIPRQNIRDVHCCDAECSAGSTPTHNRPPGGLGGGGVGGGGVECLPPPTGKQINSLKLQLIKAVVHMHVRLTSGSW